MSYKIKYTFIPCDGNYILKDLPKMDKTIHK